MESLLALHAPRPVFCRTSLLALFLAAIGFMGNFVDAAEQPVFAPLRKTSVGDAVLGLMGSPGTNYVLETSTDLSSWVPLFSGITRADGQLDFTHFGRAEDKAHFYRGREQTAFERLKVVPQPDSNFVAVALITTNGGLCSISNSDGTLYTFTVPPQAVTESVAISMTLLTNVVGFPLTNGFGAAVSFEPEGFEFYRPGMLTIRFATNLPMFDMVSYAFAGDGSGIYLMPDQVSSNSVTIPILHFSGAGTSTGGKQAGAIFARKALENAKNRVSQGIAEELGVARQLSLLGAENGTPESLRNYDKIAQDFYDQNIKPREAAALKNCDLFKALAQCAIGIERQVQLLGGATSISGRFLGEEYFCAAMKNCLEEARALCLTNPREAITKMLGIIRQQQLLGAQCVDVDILKELEACLPEWHGSVTYTETGTTNRSYKSGPYNITETRSATLNMPAWVMTSTSFGSSESFAIQLEMEAFADGSKQRHDVESLPLSCGKFHTVDTRITAAGTGKKKFLLSAQITGGQVSWLGFGVDGALKMPGIYTRTEVIPSCSSDGKGGRSSSQSTPYEESRRPLPLIIQFPNSLGDATSGISATITTNMYNEDIPVTATWKIDLKRKERSP